MCGNCRCGRSHKRSVRRRTCGPGCRRVDGILRSSRKECYRGAVPWIVMSSRVLSESFILGVREKRGQMGGDADGATGVRDRPKPTHAASWPGEDARRSIATNPGLRLDWGGWRGRMQAVLH